MVQTQLFKPEVNTWAEASTDSKNALQHNTYTYTKKAKNIPDTSYAPASPPKITIHSEEIIDPRRYVQEPKQENASLPVEADPPAKQKEVIAVPEDDTVDEVLGAVREEEVVEEVSEQPTEVSDEQPVNISTLSVEETPEQTPTELSPEQRFLVEEPQEAHLTKSKGTFNGPSGKEFYYNLNMAKVVQVMRELGFSEQDYPYWVDKYGIKRLGQYAMVAANLQTRPKGTIIESSWGLSIVVDTGSFVKNYPDGLDLAVAW